MASEAHSSHNYCITPPSKSFKYVHAGIDTANMKQQESRQSVTNFIKIYILWNQ